MGTQSAPSAFSWLLAELVEQEEGPGKERHSGQAPSVRHGRPRRAEVLKLGLEVQSQENQRRTGDSSCGMSAKQRARMTGQAFQAA
jgi:hypothetical protein